MELVAGILLGATWAGLGGFIAGAWWFKKKVDETKAFHVKNLPEEVIESIIKNKQQGEIIQVNHVENYLKENKDKEILLADVIDDD